MEYDGTMTEPTCAVCGWLLSEHGMEGYPGHPFTYRDAAPDTDELDAENARENRMHRGMERFGGTFTG